MSSLAGRRVDALLEHRLTLIENPIEGGGHGADEAQRPNVLPGWLPGEVTPEIIADLALHELSISAEW